MVSKIEPSHGRNTTTSRATAHASILPLGSNLTCHTRSAAAVSVNAIDGTRRADGRVFGGSPWPMAEA
jgi:hypothetical protein